MAWKAPQAGDLRHLIRIDRKVQTSDQMGGFTTAWAPLIEKTDALVTPSKGGEQVRAARSSGIVPTEITIRWTPTAASITAQDRAVDLRTGQTFNIRCPALDLNGHRRFVVLTCETGGLTDG